MFRTGRNLAALALGGVLGGAQVEMVLGCGPRRPPVTGTETPASSRWKGKSLHVWVPTCDATARDFRELKAGLEAHAASSVEVGVVCRTFRSDGSLLQVGLQVGAGSTPTVQAQLVAIHARPTLVVANTTGSGFDVALALAVLSDEAARTRLASDVVATFGEGGFVGIELDLEAMPTAASPYYARLVSDIRARAAATNPGVEISVDVHPKTVDDPGWEGPGAHDYRALADAGAVLRLMTYDLSIGPVPPGPTTRATWIREVVAYARGKGVPAAQLEIGLPAYGYDFPPKDKGAPTPLRHADALSLLQKTGATLEHTAEGTPHFAYEESPGVRREVWFDDATSLTRVLEDAAPIAAEVRGIAVWGLPGGDPALLDALVRLGLGGP
jgi:spore germination protein YaaH